MSDYELPPEARAALAEQGRITGRIGQQRLRARYLAQVDQTTPGLPADERQAKADALYRAHMARAGVASGVARRQKANA